MSNLLADTLENVKAAVKAIATTATVFASHVPSIDVEGIKKRSVPNQLCIYVSPDTRSTKRISRGGNYNTVTMWAVVVHPTTVGLNAVHKSADQLIDGLLMQRIGPLLCTLVEQTIPTSQEYWREHNIAASFLKITLEG